jgi:hypothetical protein
MPVSVGSPMFTGGADCTTPVAALGALTDASSLTVVTSTRTRVFSSGTPSVYEAPVAPVTTVQVAPSLERCHP